MHALGFNDRISIPVKIKSVETVANRFHGTPELSIEATLRLSSNTQNDVNVRLWASTEKADAIIVSEDFVLCDATLEAHFIKGSKGSPAKGRVAVTAIWFGDSADRNIALVMD